jgi:hypothetical protein
VPEYTQRVSAHYQNEAAARKEASGAGEAAGSQSRDNGFQGDGRVKFDTSQQ